MLPHRSAKAGGGFTLIELLVSMTVLLLMIGMLAQVFSATSRATQTSQHQIEGTRQARAVLDTLREDLENVVLQNGAGTVFAVDAPNTTPSGVTNTQLVFVTCRRGPQSATTAPRFMAVAYSVDGTQLSRGYATVPWNNATPNSADLMTEAFSAKANTATTETVDGVLRLETSLLLDNNQIVPLTATGPWSTQTFNGDPMPNGYSAYHALVPASGRADATMPKVCALIVSVATLDSNSLRLPNIANMATALTAPPAGKTGFEVWSGVIDQGGLSAYPKPAVASLRISQRTFFLR